MTNRLIAALSVVVLPLLLPGVAVAEPMTFKMLQTYSFATFKSDAPLETIVGHTAGGGIAGTLTVDPEKPQGATGTVKVDMNTVRTGHDKRDSDMRSKMFLDTEVPANRYVTFDVRSVEMVGPLVPGKPSPAKVHGTLTIKGKAVPTVADATVTYVKLTPEQAAGQKNFGFTTDNIKVRAKFNTTFSNHGMEVPQLFFLKVANDIHMETDMTFTRQ